MASVNEVVEAFVEHTAPCWMLELMAKYTFPRLQEHASGALSGVGKYGTGSLAEGHPTRYSTTYV
jgi:hypothetical protein